MALIKCPECGNEISKSAKSCPQCGHEKKARKSFGLGSFILVLVAGFYLMSAINPSDPAPAKPAVAAVKTPEELRTEEIKKAFSPWDGSHRELEKYIKRNLKDPKSYEHIETRYGDKGDHIFLYTKYRAKNSFGGYVIGEVTAKANINGTLLEIVASQ
jgi:hypothetical protein